MTRSARGGQIKQKTIKHTPADKLSDAFISLMAGAHGLVEINTRLRTDPALQRAFGRSACAEQSVVQETLDACTAENVTQLQQALDEIYRQHGQSLHHNYQASFSLLDVERRILNRKFPVDHQESTGRVQMKENGYGSRLYSVLWTGCP